MQPMRLARLFGVDAQLLHDQVASKAAGILDENNANAIGLDAVEQPVEALPTLDQIGAADRGVAIPVFIGEGALRKRPRTTIIMARLLAMASLASSFSSLNQAC